MIETIDTDVVIIGAGPAGLAAAIRLKQCAPGADVIVLEKAAEPGGHTLSGAVIDPAGLDELLPGWRERRDFAATPVRRDRFHFLGRKIDVELPDWALPPLMKTPDGLIVSLGEVVRFLAREAEALGVQIFTMTAAVEPMFDAEGRVNGVLTGDMGRHRNGQPKAGFAPGVGIRARQILVAEGARGSLAKVLISRFGLDRHSDPQKFGLGIKEVWQIGPDRHEEGRVDHYLGYPLGRAAAGGGFSYHAAGGLLDLGLVVHLDYKDPTLSPFEEFQAFKRHPSIRRLIDGGTRISYGARAIASGGLQSLPELSFPGGALIGCAAGFMNVARLKAVHNAIRSGMTVAELLAGALAEGSGPVTLAPLRSQLVASAVGEELRLVRNVKPLWSRLGPMLGAVAAGFDLWCTALTGRSPFGTLHHKGPDGAALRPVRPGKARSYPRPDGRITFSRADSVHLANISHDDDQPVHLRLRRPDAPVAETLARFGAEPSVHYCPAGVYELVEDRGVPKFRINAQNCVHCKTCDIKDPADNIRWTPPEGGSGPNYSGM